MDGHPGNKEFGDTVFTSLPYNHMLYGHWLDKVCCMNPDPMGQVVVEVVTVGGARPLEMVRVIAHRRSRPRSTPVLEQKCESR